MQQRKMTSILSKKIFMAVVIALLALPLLTGCTGAQPAPATAQPPTQAAALEPSATFVPATETQEPTAEPPAPTATQEPTATPLPELGLAPEGFTAWCQPLEVQTEIAAAGDPWVAPEGAALIDLDVAPPTLIFPARSCTFKFTFNQPAPEGLTLQVFDIMFDQPTPWLTAPLIVAEDNQNLVYTSLNHSYITYPPRWYISYKFNLVDATGKEYWSQEIQMTRNWQFKLCWNGMFPDPNTLQCPPPGWGDRHPTDFGYYLPTPTPGGDPASGYYMP